MGALARRPSPACTAASSPHNRFEINHQGRTDPRTDPPSVLLGAVALRGGQGVSTFYAISSLTVTTSGSLSEPLEVELP